MRKIGKILFSGLLIFLFCLTVSNTSKAATHTIKITPAEINNGRVKIQDYLDYQKNGRYDRLTIQFSPGTYKLRESLIIYSNTTIDATGSLIYYLPKGSSEDPGRAPLYANYCEGKRGYDGAGNITIQGGVYDCQGGDGQANADMLSEVICFLHGKNFTVTDVTVQNLNGSHHLTVEGVDGAKINNCKFYNMTDITTRKEAIHIDIMHNDEMAPSSQDNTIYDDTACKNITITNCTFDKVPRGVGSHLAVQGVYSDNIVISNNTFTNITYEAVKAYHYKNFTISNNKITKAGYGIKAYLYAEPREDTENSAKTNYLPALKGTVKEGVPANLNAKIIGNTVTNTTNAEGGFGIYVAGCASRIMNYITVQNNKVISAKQAGIYLKYVNHGMVSGNIVTKPGAAGFLNANCSDLKIHDNTVTSPKAFGIYAKNGNITSICRNSISAPGNHGIYTVDMTNPTVQNNIVKNGKKGSVFVDEGCNNALIENNQSENSGHIGIMLFSSSNAIIRGNTITKPKKFGIYTTKTNNVLVENNTVKNSGNTGVLVDNTTGGKVISNTVYKPGNYGVLFTKTKKTVAKKNAISNAKNYSLLYANNCKNKKLNLQFRDLVIKKGEKVVSGRNMIKKRVKVSVTIDKKTKTKKTNRNGEFVIKVKKLKKNKKVILSVKDKYGNMETKTVKVK